MTYDFDTPIDRSGTYSLKWEEAGDALPMWVADMDFQTAPVIREALRRRVEHGVFGYSIVPPEWNQAYVDWWGRRHGLAIDPDSLVFCTGVVPAISSMVRKLTTPNENVVIMTRSTTSSSIRFSTMAAVCLNRRSPMTAKDITRSIGLISKRNSPIRRPR